MVYSIFCLILISTFKVSALIPIGGSIEGLRDYSQSRPYVNLIRQARGWSKVDTPFDNNATFDPVTGWPTEDFAVSIASEAIDFGGTYFLSANGNANVTIEGGWARSIQNKTYDPITNTLTALVVVHEGAEGLLLKFHNTTGPGLQNISLLQPGYNLSSTSIFTDLFLAHLSRFKVLRFMDWTETNQNYEVNWNETTPLSWPRYHIPKRNPWQTIPLLVNKINGSVDIWINIPHLATDDYIVNLARLLFNELNPRSNIYFEYSNEVRNWEFPQFYANYDAANDSVLNQGDPFHFNYDYVNNSMIWANRRIAYQAKRISDLFKTVFGEENVGQWKRVRPILAGEGPNPHSIIDGLDYLNAIFAPPKTILHGVAVAPYFSLGPYQRWSNLTTDQVLEGMNISVQTKLPENGWSQVQTEGVHGTYAAWYEVAVHGYEGGPATSDGCGGCSLPAKINATRDRRLTDICITYLNAWYGYGFQPLNWFTTGASHISQYGSWGIFEDMRQETIIDTTHMFNATSPVTQLPRPSPKSKAIDTVRASSVKLTFGIPIPSFNFNATNFMNHPVPYRFPDLRNLTINSTFYYPLQIFQSPIQLNITVYTAGNSGLLEGAINNDQFTQVETPQTENSTIFAPTAVMQFRINQTILPSVVTFRLRSIQGEYSISSFDVLL